nr:MAG TPA: hypothetical protein [Caudoviricetes sp.]
MTTVEMEDGTIHGPVRILYIDKLKCERAARNNQWDMQTDEITLSGFLAWAALTRTGVVTMPYEEFIESVADVMTEVLDVNPEDPTRAA